MARTLSRTASQLQQSDAQSGSTTDPIANMTKCIMRMFMNASNVEHTCGRFTKVVTRSVKGLKGPRLESEQIEAVLGALHVPGNQDDLTRQAYASCFSGPEGVVQHPKRTYAML
jgi:hypothetical protein